MDNSGIEKLYLNEFVLATMKDCKSGVLRLDFRFIDGEITACVGARIAETREKLDLEEKV